MIKVLRAFAALIALLLAGLAPATFARPVHHAAGQAETGQVAHPALWKVAGPNSTIYLFGTIHLLPADVHWFDGPVGNAFAQSDVLVTEILEPGPAEMRAIVSAKAFLPEGQSLRALLTPDQRARLEAALSANALPATRFDGYQPWYAAVALATAPMAKLGYDPANGVDMQLGQRAQALGKPHEALETAEYQIGLFAALPQPVQKTYLMEVLRQLPQVKSELGGIIHAWKAGNATALAQLMNSGEDDPQLMQALLIDRNTNWMNWIQSRLANPQKPHEIVFIAVGAGHLAGPDSVIDQLHAIGITSQRLQ